MSYNIFMRQREPGVEYITELIKKSCIYPNYTTPIAMALGYKYHQRCLLESWHIRLELKTMNRDEGNLQLVYDVLIRQSRSSD